MFEFVFHWPAPVSWVCRLCPAVLWPCGDGRSELPHAEGWGGPAWCHQSQRCTVGAVWRSPCGPPVLPCGLETGHSAKHGTGSTFLWEQIHGARSSTRIYDSVWWPQRYFTLLRRPLICLRSELYGAHIQRWVKWITLVFAWMGAPWSSRISIILTWPFLAAQWRGVSSSWRKSISSDWLGGASHHTQIKGYACCTLVLASIWAPLSSRSRTMITFPLRDAMCRGVIPFCTEKHTRLHRRTLQEPSVVTEIKNCSTDGSFTYLWRKVDISASGEQQLSYIQVFVMCSDV